ncbi:MAG: WYL domain-containing protein [Gemmatimonadetes bacterium]|nr:WYL domain-containing protein [Gemmatimonadota bacterium]
MAELAGTQVQRLVALVAWMSQRDTGRPVRYRDAARALAVPEALLRDDLQVLIDLTDSYKPWLSSLSVALVANGFTLSSRGAFRRPLRFSHDEALALLVGLAGLRGAGALAGKLGAGFAAAPPVTEVERSWAMGPTPAEPVAPLLALFRRARDERRKVELRYCGSRGEPSSRIVHPHQVVQAGRAWYVVAWCERARAPRHFRVERVLGARALEEGFEPRKELRRVTRVRDLLAADGAVTATVAFSPVIARWIRELYPEGSEGPDGRYLVRLPVADPRWLAREILQYGAEAEVLEPASLRDFVRAVVS